MQRAISMVPAGHWDRSAEAGTVTLDWDDRHRRRCRFETDQGRAFLLDLAQAERLGDGSGLLLEDGGVIRVVARAEPVLEIRAGTAGLPRLAYHLGNRHLAIQILDDVLVIRADAVIATMVEGLGGIVSATERPFDPEPGAYGGSHRHEAGGGGHHAHG